MSENLKKLLEDIKMVNDNFTGVYEENPYIGYLAIAPTKEEIGEEYFFQGEEYENLIKEYETESGICEYITFEEYIIYTSQSW